MRGAGHRPGAAVVAALWIGGCAAGGDATPLRAHGSVEARQVRVASRTGARVLRVLVDENDAVAAGQPLVVLDVRELEAARDQARAALAQAAARERLLVRGARREDVVEARNALAAAQARLDQAARDLERSERLRAGDAVAPSALEAARTAAELARSDVEARRAQLQKVVGGARAEELEEAAAARTQAEAALAAAEDRLRDRVLESPIAGTVIHRLVEPGEVARPAAPLLVLADLGRPYLDVYVPEARLADARMGTPAEVRVDAVPGRTFRATVAHVASEAEFTPKNVQTDDQRARLVFRVRLDVEDPDGLLRPGMPGAATFAPAAAPAPAGPPAPDGKRKS